MPTINLNIDSPPAIKKEISQAGHGFVVGDVLRISGTNAFAKAQADSAANARVVGIVTAVADANTFTLTLQGSVTAGVPAQAAGTVMYLSASIAGALTATAPGTNDTPVLVILENAVSAIFINSLFVAPGSPGGSAIVPITRVALQALLSGGTADTTVIYRITNALGSTAEIDVFAITASAISGNAIDHTNNNFGFYNIIGDSWINLYEPNVNLTANRAVVSDGSGNLAVATTTATEIGYVNGVTSAIQTQLNAKANQDSSIIGTSPGGSVVPTGPGTDRFFPLLSTNTSGVVTESQRQNVMPRAGTFSRFYVMTQTAQGGAGALTITCRKNGGNTSLEVVIAAGSAPGTFSDLVNNFTVNAGDLVAIRGRNDHTANSAGITSTTVDFQRS